MMPPRFTPEQEAEMLALRDEGMTCDAIGLKFGTTSGMVSKVTRRLGKRVRSPRQVPSYEHDPPTDPKGDKLKRFFSRVDELEGKCRMLTSQMRSATEQIERERRTFYQEMVKLQQQMAQFQRQYDLLAVEMARMGRAIEYSKAAEVAVEAPETPLGDVLGTGTLSLVPRRVQS